MNKIKMAYAQFKNLLARSKYLNNWYLFSLVAIEAQAHGLPVIAFDIKGPHDIIKSDF